MARSWDIVLVGFWSVQIAQWIVHLNNPRTIVAVLVVSAIDLWAIAVSIVMPSSAVLLLPSLGIREVLASEYADYLGAHIYSPDDVPTRTLEKLILTL